MKSVAISLLLLLNLAQASRPLVDPRATPDTHRSFKGVDDFTFHELRWQLQQNGLSLRGDFSGNLLEVADQKLREFHADTSIITEASQKAVTRDVAKLYGMNVLAKKLEAFQGHLMSEGHQFDLETMTVSKIKASSRKRLLEDDEDASDCPSDFPKQPWGQCEKSKYDYVEGKIKCMQFAYHCWEEFRSTQVGYTCEYPRWSYVMESAEYKAERMEYTAYTVGNCRPKIDRTGLCQGDENPGWNSKESACGNSTSCYKKEDITPDQRDVYDNGTLVKKASRDQEYWCVSGGKPYDDKEKSWKMDYNVYDLKMGDLCNICEKRSESGLCIEAHYCGDGPDGEYLECSNMFKEPKSICRDLGVLLGEYAKKPGEDSIWAAGEDCDSMYAWPPSMFIDSTNTTITHYEYNHWMTNYDLFTEYQFKCTTFVNVTGRECPLWFNRQNCGNYAGAWGPPKQWKNSNGDVICKDATYFDKCFCDNGKMKLRDTYTWWEVANMLRCSIFEGENGKKFFGKCYCDSIHADQQGPRTYANYLIAHNRKLARCPRKFLAKCNDWWLFTQGGAVLIILAVFGIMCSCIGIQGAIGQFLLPMYNGVGTGSAQVAA